MDARVTNIRMISKANDIVRASEIDHPTEEVTPTYDKADNTTIRGDEATDQAHDNDVVFGVQARISKVDKHAIKRPPKLPTPRRITRRMRLLKTTTLRQRALRLRRASLPMVIVHCRCNNALRHF